VHLALAVTTLTDNTVNCSRHSPRCLWKVMPDPLPL